MAPVAVRAMLVWQQLQVLGGVGDAQPGEVRQRVHAVPERKERVRGGNGSRERALRLFYRETARIHAAHLTGTDPHQRVVLRDHDGVGFHVLRTDPREPQRALLGLGRSPLGDS